MPIQIGVAVRNLASGAFSSMNLETGGPATAASDPLPSLLGRKGRGGLLFIERVPGWLLAAGSEPG